MTEEATSNDGSETCANCEEAPATTVWGFPVCEPCKSWLASIDGDLRAMEDSSPELKTLGERVERLWAEHSQKTASAGES